MSLSGTTPKRRHPDQPALLLNRVTLFTVLGALVPGLGLIAAKRRIAGGIILGLFLAALAVLGVWAIADRGSLIALALHPGFLRPMVVVSMVVGAVWVAIIVASHLALRGDTVQVRPQRIIGSVVVAALAFLVAAPTAVAARYAYDSASLVSSVFQQQGKSNSATRPTMKPTNKKDPWANTPRVNILLLGGDSDNGKREGVRTDTVIVASVDTKTGDTVLISLPRNTARVPFPSNSPLKKYYPKGFTNGDGTNAEYMLNAMYRNVPNTVPKDVLGKTDNLGADVLKIGVGEAVGLKIHYYVLIDIVGFKQLINALGGITVNINTKVAIGGDTDAGIPPRDYLEPGANQHLSGYEAMWFARGRYGADDFQRMDRQRCVIDAIIKQANPTNVVSRYEAIARASKSLIITDISQETLPAFVDLSLRVKAGNVRSIVFKNAVAGFSSANPNWSSVRSRVKASLGEVKKSSPTAKKPSSSTSTSTSRKPSSARTTQASEDISDACAYNPE